MSIDIPSLLMGKALGSGGGGGGGEVEALSVTENGTYTAPTGKAYSPVTVNVGGDPALPAEYQRVEYLHNDGNCWCEISAQPIYGDNISVSFSLDADAPAGENGVVGTSASSGAWEIYTQSNAIYFWGAVSGTTVSNIERDTKYTVVGTFSNYSGYASNFLWGRYRNDTKPYYGKMYACDVYCQRGQTKLYSARLVPCYRKADNVPGFYDLANSVFYTNAGTGTFGIGPDVN